MEAALERVSAALDIGASTPFSSLELIIKHTVSRNLVASLDSRRAASVPWSNSSLHA